MKIKSEVEQIDVMVHDDLSCNATIWRGGKCWPYHNRYLRITPASFHRLQKAQAALVKKMFGRSK